MRIVTSIQCVNRYYVQFWMVLNALSQNTPIIIKWPCLISSYIEIIYLSVWHMNSHIAHTLNACYCIFISQNNVIISSMSNQFVCIWHKQSRKAKTKEKERTFQWNEVFFCSDPKRVCDRVCHCNQDYQCLWVGKNKNFRILYFLKN